jgi:hypothetical protein
MGGVYAAARKIASGKYRRGRPPVATTRLRAVGAPHSSLFYYQITDNFSLDASFNVTRIIKLYARGITIFWNHARR